MICKTVRLPFKFGTPIRFKPIFDIHLGNRFCDVKAFREYMADCDDHTYFLGGGDLFDAVIAKDEKRYKKSSDGSPDRDDAILDYQRALGRDILKPYAKRILALGIGNHEETIVKKCSHNMIKTLCEQLEIPYGGYTYFLRVILENGTNKRKVDFRVHHGYGSTRTDGGDITKYSRDAGRYDADCQLFGHGHKKQHYSRPIIGTNGKALVASDRVVVLCGTFLKTLSSNTDATYSEIAGFPPISIGSPVINIMVKHDGYTIKVTT